jgi:histidinol dehydrogenase
MLAGSRPNQSHRSFAGRVPLPSVQVMRVQRWSDMTEVARQELIARGLGNIFDPELREAICALIDDVKVRGDEALCDALRIHDRIEISADQLRVTDDEIDQAVVGDDLDRAIDDAIAHLRSFNEHQLERFGDWGFVSEPGLMVGERITPISSVGLFTPSGKASYPSVAYQLAVPAMVAAVPSISLAVPPLPGGAGEVDPAVLTVCRKLDIRSVFRVNGPAGIAALGFGTETIEPVRKIVGPGSPAVTIAQVEMQRHGVTTMMLLGPTESMIVADDSADPLRLAADLLIEAEHGTDSSVVLVTDSAELANRTDDEVARQIVGLPPLRAEAARAALGANGGCVLVESIAQAVDVANRYAPEHLQVVVSDRDIDAVVDSISNAGEILIGQHTPFSAANFVIGCPASLPTSGFAHVSSGITAATFLKRTAVARADEAALDRMSKSIISLAEHEGFPAHAAAIRIRA